jgi:hypothetical protein
LKDADPSKWAALYKLKLKYCHQIANFQAESKKNPDEVEFRERKRECLIELIDILDDAEGAEYLLNEEILRASMVMITKNIYRTFTNKKNNKKQE